MQRYFFLIFFWCAFFSASAKEAIILIHGLGRGPSSLSVLSERLESTYPEKTVIRLRYPRRQFSFEEALSILKQQLLEEHTQFERYHFVGHSLGGLLSLHLVQSLSEGQRGLCITLGSPFKGSFLLEEGVIFDSFVRPFYGPIVEDLQKNLIFPSLSDVYAIAGTSCAWDFLNLLPLVYSIEGKHDCFVSENSALGFEAKDHLSFLADHNSLLSDPLVLDSIITIFDDYQH